MQIHHKIYILIFIAIVIIVGIGFVKINDIESTYKDDLKSQQIKIDSLNTVIKLSYNKIDSLNSLKDSIIYKEKIIYQEYEKTSAISDSSSFNEDLKFLSNFPSTSN